jgi:hypothetical protein
VVGANPAAKFVIFIGTHPGIFLRVETDHGWEPWLWNPWWLKTDLGLLSRCGFEHHDYGILGAIYLIRTFSNAKVLN